MSTRKTTPRRLGRHVFFCLLASVFFSAAPQLASAAGDLTVEEFAGPVKLKVDDRWQDPRVGMSVSLPATVSTGEDGSIELAQGGSVFSVASNTALEIFASPDSGQLVTRIVQSQGSAFYDITDREHKKLRVETPYLAAVIKGTQFNVTVELERSSISLYEGLLRIEAPDIGQAVDLRAGFIARRRAGDTTISVIPMDGSEAASGRRSGLEPSSSDDGAGSGTDRDLAGAGSGRLDADEDAPLRADLDLDGVNAPVGAVGDFGITKESLALETTGSADLGSGDISADLGADAGVGDLADLGVDAGVEADLGSGDLGADVGVDAGVGDVADLGVDAGVEADLGSGDLGADLGVDAGVGDVADLGADAGVEADLGSGDLGVDLGADADVAGVDAGVDAGVEADLGSGELGADAGVGDVDLVDVGVDDGGLDVATDLGLLDETVDVVDDLLGDDTATEDTTQDEEEEPAIVPDLGDLIGL